MKTPTERRIPITVTLLPSVVDQIDQIAAEQDLPRSRITSRAIAEYIERRRAEAAQPEGDTP